MAEEQRSLRGEAALPVKPALLAPEIGPTYARIRHAQRELNSTLTKSLTKKAIVESAKRLGFWRKGRLSFETEDDSDVLMDFAIHDYRPGGKNAVERFILNHGAELAVEQDFILDAMTRARFTLVEIGRPVGPSAVEAHDLLYHEDFLLADEGLAMTADDGVTIAARIVPLGPFSMTTGAPLPFDPDLAGAFLAGMRRTWPEGVPATLRSWSRTELAKMSARLITWALQDPEDVIASLPEGDPDALA